MPMTETTDKIVFRLVRTNVLTRWHCHICGGETEKVSILCESGDDLRVGLRICESCLSCRDFDAHLEGYAQALEAEAARTRALIGRIEAPSFAEWEKATAEDAAEWEREERAAGRGAQVDAINAALVDFSDDELPF
jgi:hypothetical protein